MIDAKLVNGDLAADASGRVEQVSGVDATVQRAAIRMTVPKGSFVYDRELGAEPFVPGDSGRTEALFSEALAPYENTEVTSVRLTEDAAVVGLEINGEGRETEVRFYRNV